MSNKLYGCAHYQHEESTVATLADLASKADYLVPDTCIIPTLRRQLPEISAERKRNATALYSTLSDILAGENVYMHSKIRREMTTQLRHERDTAESMKRSDTNEHYRKAIDSVQLPAPTPLHAEDENIYHQVTNALFRLDDELGIRKTKHDADHSTTDIENLAYAITLSLQNPDEHVVVCTRDIDYLRLFHAFIGYMHSVDFSEQNSTELHVPSKFGNPKLSITWCEERNPHHPYRIKESTKYIQTGRQHDWRKYGLQNHVDKEKVREIVGTCLIDILAERSTEEQPQGTEPTYSNNGIVALYETLHPQYENLDQCEPGELQTKLTALQTLRELAKGPDKELNPIRAGIDKLLGACESTIARRMDEIEETLADLTELRDTYFEMRQGMLEARLMGSGMPPVADVSDEPAIQRKPQKYAVGVIHDLDPVTVQSTQITSDELAIPEGVDPRLYTHFLTELQRIAQENGKKKPQFGDRVDFGYICQALPVSKNFTRDVMNDPRVQPAIDAGIVRRGKGKKYFTLDDTLIVPILQIFSEKPRLINRMRKLWESS